ARGALAAGARGLTPGRSPGCSRALAGALAGVLAGVLGGARVGVLAGARAGQRVRALAIAGRRAVGRAVRRALVASGELRFELSEERSLNLVIVGLRAEPWHGDGVGGEHPGRAGLGEGERGGLLFRR